uniref:Uncharacterized protein n=1 Tax=Myoviridae sp. ctlnK45 TaxID=2826693 RepID=A0A8S5NP94_9CAUD|nr:MAG TPA: hypothetical protein [Myoviridae sp. ctlnK45]
MAFSRRRPFNMFAFICVTSIHLFKIILLYSFNSPCQDIFIDFLKKHGIIKTTNGKDKKR